MSGPRTTDRAVDALVVRALTLTANGNVAGALAAFRGATAGREATEILTRARPILDRLEGRATQGSAPPATTPRAPASPAWACAWAGDLAGARRLAGERPDDPGTSGLLGVLEVLEGRPGQAIALLDGALAAGGGEDLALHRARALLHLGRVDEARQALAALVDGEAFSRRLLVALMYARSSHDAAAFLIWRRLVAPTEAHLNGLFTSHLPALLGRAELDRALGSAAALAACLEGVLDRMAGNLGPSPTLAEVAPDGGRRFVYLDLPPTTRDQAVAALGSLRHLGPAGAGAAFEQLRARHPRSIHAHTYRGELALWMGRYDEAWRAFVTAQRIEPARWAAIGMLAVLVLTERTWPARLMTLYAERRFPFIRGSTLPVYRGALRRRTGELEAAVEDLSTALAAKPTRVGARIELCLALRAAGRRAEAVEHAAMLVRDAAPLLVDAAEARALDWRAEPGHLAGDAVLDEALAAMRGNRSSSIVTWVDRSGALRILASREAMAAEAQRALAELSAGALGRRPG